VNQFISADDGTHVVLSRRSFCALAASALAAGCATADRHAAPAQRTMCTKPITYDEHGGLFIDAMINGHGPKRFILDTGASRSALSESLAHELGLTLAEGGEVEGSAGAFTVKSAIAKVDIAPLASLDIDFTVYALGSYDPLCVGILGYEFLRLAPFQIRYRQRLLSWNAAPPPAAHTIALTLDNNIPRVLAMVNRQPMPLRIDTGATLAPSEESYLNLTQDQAAAAGLSGRPQMVFSASGAGGATLELPVFALRSLHVAEQEIPKAFAIVQPRVGYFARDDAVGFLGNSVLEKIDPFLDYSSGVFGWSSERALGGASR
jgi:predicted aspartyl protease